MTQTNRVDVLFPVGRLVSGSVSEANTTDYQGRPLTVKSGPNVGQPRIEYSFGVAIPKGGEQHWNQTEWGGKIWHAAAAAFPDGAYQQPTFSWKITDGDSTQPNTVGNVPNQREGYAGHWVVYFSSGHPPKLVDSTGQNAKDPAEFKRGYYVQPYGNVTGNGATGNQAGVFLNHSIVAWSAFGDEIRTGPDASQVGFGGGQLPQGASQTPPAGSFNPATQPPAQPGYQQGPAQPPAQPGYQRGPAQPPAQPGYPQGPAQPPAQPGYQQGPAQPPAQPGYQQGPAQPPAQPIQPAHDFGQPPAAQQPAPAPRRLVQGVAYDEAALAAANYTPEQIAALPVAP